jgi:hypothetical protein
MDYEKKYKEALERARQFSEKPYLEDSKGIVDYIFPELKESEGERTWIINYLSNRILNSTIIAEKENLKKAIAWVEKQGEQKPVEPQQDMLSQEKYAKAVDECIYEEQKPADKVEPKFKVGDTIQPKDRGHEPWKIMQVDILDKKYRFKDGYVIHFSQEDNYELVEQNAWSEEDKERYISCLQRLGTGDPKQPETINSKWFKEHVYPQSTWKPSDEQMEALVSAIDVMIDNRGAGDKNTILLSGLYHKLKKLREE